MINICYCGDNGYVSYMLTSIKSLAINTRHNVKIFILSDKISKKNLQLIGNVLGVFAHIKREYIKINTKSVEGLTTNANHITIATYYRFLMHQYIRTDRIIYIDGDTLIRGDIQNLRNEDLGVFVFGAVSDKLLVDYQERQTTLQISNYFNAGVMLINLNSWKQKNISKKAQEYIKHNNKKIKYADQCGLNAVSEGLWKQLDNKFNYMTSYYSAYGHRKNTIVRHYTGSNKPRQLSYMMIYHDTGQQKLNNDFLEYQRYYVGQKNYAISCVLYGIVNLLHKLGAYKYIIKLKRIFIKPTSTGRYL